jgi:hypothetical protein
MMRRWRSLLAAAACVPLVLAGSSSAPILVSASPADASGGKHALLIGIDTYPHARQLKGAVNDVEAMRRILTGDLGVPAANVQVLTNEQATRQAMLDALAGLQRRTRPGDAVLIYYSGHGWLVKDENGDESTFNTDEQFDEALVPYDAVPWPRERAYEPNPTLLIDDDISRALGPLPGRRVAVIMDSCHSGNALRSLPGEDVGRSLYDNAPLPTSRFKSLDPRKPSLDMGGQVVFIAAAQWRQTASDLGEFQGRRHGALTASLLRTMEKAGPGWANVLSWQALFRQAREDLLAQGIAAQTPSITGSPMIGRAPVAQFFAPPASAEIAEFSAPPAFDVYLEANKYQFLAGEQMELVIESERSGYLYVFDVDAEKKVTQLFPNRFEKENALAAGTQAKVPAARSRYQFTADKPYGTSTIVALVTREKWDEHTRLDLPATLSPLSAAQEGGLRDSLRGLAGQDARKAEWAHQKITVEVVASRAEADAPPVSVAPSGAPSKPAAAPPVLAVIPATPPGTAPPARASGAASASVPASAATARAASLDDADITWDEQQDLPRLRPALYRRLEQLAERFSPVFWQDVSGSTQDRFRPWKDFFVRYDFDQTSAGPNWPEPPRFQDENKRARIRSLDVWLDQQQRAVVQELTESPGVFRVTDKGTGEVSVLDLRPYVYWTVLATPTHYFFHYAAFKAEDWKAMFGHPGDLEGCTIIVDRKTERMVGALTLAHDDVQVTRGLDGENEANIEVLVDPSLATRDLNADEARPINGALRMDASRAGEAAPKEHQDIYSETRGHGQYGPNKIVPTRYIVYANFLPEETWRAPSFTWADYVVSDRFADVRAKYKYRLVYFGTGRSSVPDPAQKTLWSEYRDLSRFPGGANPPWCWRDNLLFRTGWWKDPRTILKIGDDRYLINPYLTPGGVR